jgi:hypothetical protein
MVLRLASRQCTARAGRRKAAVSSRRNEIGPPVSGQKPAPRHHHRAEGQKPPVADGTADARF